MNEKLKYSIISIASLFVTVGLTYFLFPNLISFMVILVLIAHEMGHYLTGFMTGADAYLPIFIPLVLFTIGITRLKGVKHEFKALVALAGPVSGAAFALACFILALFAGNFALAGLAIVALVFEIISGTLGSDGRRYRNARRNTRGTSNFGNRNSEHSYA